MTTKSSATSAFDALEHVLQRIESEPLAAATARERQTFDHFAGPFGNRLVLFGAGPLGREVLAGLRLVGLAPLAFADNNQQLWGKELLGLPVLSPSQAAEMYGQSACFVVTIYNGSSARAQLAELGCQRIAPFAALYWKYPEVFVPERGIELPHAIPAHAGQIRACYASLSDEHSRRDLREQLLWRYELDYGALSPALDPANTYFPLDLFSPREDEVFVDCGAYDGDTIRSFAKVWGGKFRHIFAFEPDQGNLKRLLASTNESGTASRITVMPYAVGGTNGCLSFECTNSIVSRITMNDSAFTTAECRRLDDLDLPIPPTFIKMDIEGAEPDALRGATELLRRYLPVLAICTYHRCEHLWDIPNLIRSISDQYSIYLRRYAEECWEGVCYAIPKHRLKDR